MGKARDLLNNLGDFKGTFHARMGTIKGRKGEDLMEAKEIKKRWQEWRRTAQKGLNDPDNHDGVISHQTFWSVKSGGP